MRTCVVTPKPDGQERGRRSGSRGALRLPRCTPRCGSGLPTEGHPRSSSSAIHALCVCHGPHDRLELLRQILDLADVPVAELLVACAAPAHPRWRRDRLRSRPGSVPSQAPQRGILQQRRRWTAAVAVPRAVVVRVGLPPAAGVEIAKRPFAPQVERLDRSLPLVVWLDSAALLRRSASSSVCPGAGKRTSIGRGHRAKAERIAGAGRACPSWPLRGVCRAPPAGTMPPPWRPATGSAVEEPARGLAGSARHTLAWLGSS